MGGLVPDERCLPLLFFLGFLFPHACIRPIVVLPYDHIIHRYRPVEGALPYSNMNAGRFDYKKKKKKKLTSYLYIMFH